MKRALSLGLITLLLIGLLAGCTQQVQAPSGDPNKKAMLVVSFGTSYSDTRELTIDAINQRFVDAFPEYDVVEAYTSQIIIDILKDRDKLEVYNVKEAMDHLKAEGYGEVIVQPTHVMNGAEYDDVVAEVLNYEEDMNVKIGHAILSSIEDYERVIEALVKHMPERGEKEAVVLMGHGTHHFANAAYAALDYMLEEKGVNNVFVGTVEGYPTFDDVVKKLEENEIDKVTLMPFMIVSGDHAQNDMDGDEDDSWKTMLKKDGYIVESKLMGLGEMTEIQDLIIEHAENAILGEEVASAE